MRAAGIAITAENSGDTFAALARVAKARRKSVPAPPVLPQPSLAEIIAQMRADRANQKGGG
ncbi:hypothetical protein CCR84_12975 [Rhodocyclus purpureus]|nr:hypothetical protein [Rhodocyclus purpureus]